MAKKTQIRRLYVATEDAFGVDPSPTGVLYKYLRAECELPAVFRQVIESTVQNDTVTRSAPDMGRKNGTFTARIPLRATGVPSIVGTPAGAPEVDEILSHLIGAPVRGETSAVTPGGVGANVNVTSSDGFEVGGLVWATADGKPYFVVAKPLATSVTLFPAPAAPIVAGNLIAANYYKPVNAGLKSLAFVHVVDDVVITFTGCKLTGRINGMGISARPVLEISVESDSYIVGDAAKDALPVAADRFPAVRCPIVKGAPFSYGRLVAGAYVAPTTKPVNSVDFDFGIDNPYIETTEAANNRAGFDVVRRATQITADAYYDADFASHQDTAEDVGVGFATGTQNTGFGVFITKGRHADVPFTDIAGMVGQRLTIGAYGAAPLPDFVVSVF